MKKLNLIILIFLFSYNLQNSDAQETIDERWGGNKVISSVGQKFKIVGRIFAFKSFIFSKGREKNQFYGDVISIS